MGWDGWSVTGGREVAGSNPASPDSKGQVAASSRGGRNGAAPEDTDQDTDAAAKTNDLEVVVDRLVRSSSEHAFRG